MTTSTTHEDTTNTNIIPFVKPQEEKIEYVFNCNCFYDKDTTQLSDEGSVFLILMDGGYECMSCGKHHTYEDVHGNIDKI